MRTQRLAVAGAVALLAMGHGLPASADEVTLRGASVFAQGTTFARAFERFIERVNEEGEGLVRIEYVGGPEAIPPFEIGNAIETGIVDIANTSGAFYSTQLPLADALKMAQLSGHEMRENGAWELVNEFHNEQMNAWYLARTGTGVPFHLYVNERIEEPDLGGLRLRVTPTYRAFFGALGGTLVVTAPGEVYTALERGAVDGYGWPVQGILDLGWHEHARYRVDPGFYNVDVSILVNLDTWNGLTDAQRDFLTGVALWVESLDEENEEINARELERQAEAGIETITFEGKVAERWLSTAYEAGWAEAEEIDPENAPRLRELISR
jgi:TRAP-type transport system periplasmic protein